jgi:RNA polymerase sigma-70 factor, ECF subfamily
MTTEFAISFQPTAYRMDAKHDSFAIAEHRRALDSFLRGIERRALRMAELGCRNAHDALDIVQDAMLAFVKSYGATAESAKPSADWQRLFYTVLDSKLADFHRRQSVRNRFRVFFSGRDDEELDQIQQVPDQDSVDALRNIADSQSRAAISAALKQLPDRQRQAFLLRIWEGFDVEQTAVIMKCSDGSVKTHLSRAMEKLRVALEPLR